MQSESGNKVKQYESFINDTLKVDLAEIESKLNAHMGELNKWRDVKKAAKLLDRHNTAVKDRALNIYTRLFAIADRELMVKAEVDDRRLYVNVGCGCLLEMDTTEADKYADIRIRMIERQIEHHRQQAVKVKVNLKLVLLAINELNPLI